MFPLDEGVAEPESGCSKFVQNRRIEVLVVILTGTLLQWQQTEFLHFHSTDNDGQPFVECDVLHLGGQNSSGLLVEALVVPSGIQTGQFSRQSVVFTQENRMGHGLIGVLVHSRCITYKAPNKV